MLARVQHLTTRCVDFLFRGSLMHDLLNRPTLSTHSYIVLVYAKHHVERDVQAHGIDMSTFDTHSEKQQTYNKIYW